jgi:hypothetical protein
MNDSINAMSVYTSAGVTSVHLAGYFRSPSVEIGNAIVQNIHGASNLMDAFAARVLMAPPTTSPTRAPTAPTRVPTNRPTVVGATPAPTTQPTLAPTPRPTAGPTKSPSTVWHHSSQGRCIVSPLLAAAAGPNWYRFVA